MSNTDKLVLHGASRASREANGWICVLSVEAS